MRVDQKEARPQLIDNQAQHTIDRKPTERHHAKLALTGKYTARQHLAVRGKTDRD